MTDDVQTDRGGGEPLRDWYLEDGRVVFTAAYHLKRGYCCGSGCRHCPYGDETGDAGSRDLHAG